MFSLSALHTQGVCGNRLPCVSLPLYIGSRFRDLRAAEVADARDQSVRPTPGFPLSLQPLNRKARRPRREDGEGLHVLRSAALLDGWSLGQRHR